LSYVNVAEANRAVAAAKAGGGRLLHGPMEVPGGSWIAMIMDPQGGPFAVQEAPRATSQAKPAAAAAPKPSPSQMLPRMLLFQLDNASAVNISQIPAGNLVIVSAQSAPELGLDGSTLGMRATWADSTTPAAVLFVPEKAPTYWLFPTDPLCVDLGVRANVIAELIPGGFTTDYDAFAGGNLAIVGNSVCIIADLPLSQNAKGGMLLVDVGTGKLVLSEGSRPRWCVLKWQFGYVDARGDFTELYSSPEAKTPTESGALVCE
jgi:hypothetical protein